MSERRLIDADAVIKHLNECEGTPPEIGYTYPIFKAIECFVEGLPTIDAVEVVRCKNCWRYPEGLCGYEHKDTPGKDFCGCGERKDNENR